MIPRQPESKSFMVPNPAERILEDEREAIAIKRPSRTNPRGALNFNETWRFSQ